MKERDITDKLIKLPSMFHRRGNVSIYDLLKETGYFEMNQQISEKIIQAALLQHPECVDEWLNYSEDKRTSTGWYLRQEGINTYVIGFIEKEIGGKRQSRFIDRITACAAFIKREVEDIRSTKK